MRETNALRGTNLLRIITILGLLLSVVHSQNAFCVPIHAADKDSGGGHARDGSHDFDFNVGVWHTHIRRTLDPFSPSSEVIDLNGTVAVRPIWGGRAKLEEIEADGPKGHWEGLSLFLYNPKSHQWRQSFINSKTAVFSAPLVGECHDGRGALDEHDSYHYKQTLVREVRS